MTTDLDTPTQDLTHLKKENFSPATFSNVFQLVVTPEVARISFGDAVIEHDAMFHTRIAMNPDNLKKLADAIYSLLENHTANQQAATENVGK